MLTTDEFQHWCAHLQLSTEAQELIATIRSSPPVRKVRGRLGAVAGRYPSPKMGRTIQFESQRVELWAIYAMERDDDVLEYYDQPIAVPLRYRTASGRMTTQWHVPDFFVLRRNGASFEEWTSASALAARTRRMPGRYQEEQGVWRCPPGEAYATLLGLSYQIRSSASLHPLAVQNFSFLQDYWAHPAPVTTAEEELVLATVGTMPGISVAEVLATHPGLVVDVVWALLATGRVFTDLSATSLMHHDQVALYPDEPAWRQAAEQAAPPEQPQVFPELVLWDKRLWQVEAHGELVTLRPEVGAAFLLSATELEELLAQGIVRAVTAATPSPLDQAVRHILLRARPAALSKANDRLRQILAYRRGEAVTASRRSIQRWSAAYARAEAQHGCGYLGLLDRVAERGNRTGRASQASLQLLETVLKEHYATPQAKRAAEVYLLYREACARQGLPPVSERTFYRVRARLMTPAVVAARSGRRAAYTDRPFFFYLDRLTPRHGERPFALAHLDHTELDILLVSSLTGKPFGRPWLTLLTDAYSRRILAAYVSYEPPSYRSAMMVFRLCVQRHQRLPQAIVVDGGTDFGGVAFETVLARYFITKHQRPAEQPRAGSLIERLFGTTTTELLNQLRGNTQAAKQVRQLTRAVDPREQAVWTLADFSAIFAEWAYEVYDQMEHPALGQSPREAFAQGMQLAGTRLHRLIPYSEEFIMLTRPPTRNGQAKIHPSRGITVQWLHYWNEIMRLPQVIGQTVPVRYEPYDMGVIYAFIDGQWRECVADAYAHVHGRSEREWQLILEEWREHHRQHSQHRLSINGPLLAAFLEKVATQEAILVQRQRDLEGMPIRAAIVGRPQPLVPGTEILPSEAERDDEALDLSAVPQYEEYR
jgi:putative transposase